MKVRIAKIALADHGLHFFGSLGDASGPGHEHQFIGVFSDDHPSLPEVIASARSSDRSTAGLGPYHSYPLGPGSALRVW